MKEFIKKFERLYKWKHLYFINIFDTYEKECVKSTIENNVTYIEYFFNDEHPNGRNKTSNPQFWLGKISYWDNILSKITINKNLNMNFYLKIKRLIHKIKHIIK